MHCLTRHWSGKLFCLQDSIKAHNMTDHYPSQVKALGHSIKAHGCEIGERSHKDFVHEPFIQTSRRRKEMLMEMMLVQKRKNIASILKRSIEDSSIINEASIKDSRERTDDKNNNNNNNNNSNGQRLSSLLVGLQDGVYKLYQKNKTKLSCVDAVDHIHYKLNLEILALLLKEHWGKDYFCLQGHQCWLRKGIRVTSPESTSLFLKANPRRAFNRYDDTRSRYHREFSFVRARVSRSEGFETHLCKVLAIVEVVEVVSVRVDFILRIMESCNDRYDWDIPFYVYKFSEKIIASTLDDISLSQVCVIPQNLTEETIFELDSILEPQFYYEVPVDRITKSNSITYTDLRTFCSDMVPDEEKCFCSEEIINQWAYKLNEMHNNVIEEKTKLRLKKEKAEHDEKIRKRVRI